MLQLDDEGFALEGRGKFQSRSAQSSDLDSLFFRAVQGDKQYNAAKHNENNMNGTELDQQIRLKAFGFLSAQVEQHGQILPRSVLAEGFLFEGNQIRLVGPQGIFKPHLMDLPLSITTSPIIEGQLRPYDDGFEEGGLLRYAIEVMIQTTETTSG